MLNMKINDLQPTPNLSYKLTQSFEVIHLKSHPPGALEAFKVTQNVLVSHTTSMLVYYIPG